jgi:hypothetical protein
MRQILDLPKWESALPFIDIGPVPGGVCAPLRGRTGGHRREEDCFEISEADPDSAHVPQIEAQDPSLIGEPWRP